MAALASVADSLATGTRRARAAADGSPALRAALAPFLAAKIVAFLVPLLVLWSTGNFPGNPTYHDWANTFGYWDGQNYLGIAQHGYPTGPLDLTPGHPGHLWGFFPGLPILMRAFMFVFQDATTSGIIVASIGEFFALFYLARLVLLLRGGDIRAAAFACWLLAFYPDAVHLSVIYTDGTFIAAATASMYYMLRGHSGRASIAAAVAMAMRISGIAVIVALLVHYLWKRRGRIGTDIVDILLALAPLLLFMWFAQHQTGDFFAYRDVQQSASYGSRSMVPPWSGLVTTWKISQGGGAASYNFLFLSDVVWGTLGFVAICYFALNWRRIPPMLTVYSAGIWVLITSFTYWAGMMRYEMALIPLYIVGADLWRRRPQVGRVLLAVSGAWMVVQTYAFATGRFLV